MSKKLSNGSIVSLEFYTAFEDSELEDSVLFKKVYDSTWNDINETIRSDKLAKSVLSGIEDGIKFEEKLNA
jgi:hypothetical protein